MASATKRHLPLADFTKFLKDLHGNLFSRSPLHSVAHDFGLYFHRTLNAEIRRHSTRAPPGSHFWHPYHVWSILVSLKNSSVIVRADHKGRRTPDGMEVEANIDDVRAEGEHVVIIFTAELQSLEYL
jgi:hypothetical protein